MSRREWRCRNPECGAVLGHLTSDGGLRLNANVAHVSVQLRASRASVTCGSCGRTRTFVGMALYSG